MMKKKNNHSDHVKEVVTGAHSRYKRFSRRRPGNHAERKALLYGVHLNHAVRVLFVEDNIFNQELANFILNKLGCVTDIANNGTEAIAMMKAAEYDLVLMDVNMPGLDGYETTRIFREQLLVEIPIIAFTTNLLEEDVRKCLQSGMNDHLGKPYTEQQLSLMIHKWTSGSF